MPTGQSPDTTNVVITGSQTHLPLLISGSGNNVPYAVTYVDGREVWREEFVFESGAWCSAFSNNTKSREMEPANPIVVPATIDFIPDFDAFTLFSSHGSAINIQKTKTLRVVNVPHGANVSITHNSAPCSTIGTLGKVSFSKMGAVSLSHHPFDALSSVTANGVVYLSARSNQPRLAPLNIHARNTAVMEFERSCPANARQSVIAEGVQFLKLRGTNIDLQVQSESLRELNFDAHWKSTVAINAARNSDDPIQGPLPSISITNASVGQHRRDDTCTGTIAIDRIGYVFLRNANITLIESNEHETNSIRLPDVEQFARGTIPSFIAQRRNGDRVLELLHVDTPTIEFSGPSETATRFGNMRDIDVVQSRHKRTTLEQNNVFHPVFGAKANGSATRPKANKQGVFCAYVVTEDSTFETGVASNYLALNGPRLNRSTTLDDFGL